MRTKRALSENAYGAFLEHLYTLTTLANFSWSNFKFQITMNAWKNSITWNIKAYPVLSAFQLLETFKGLFKHIWNIMSFFFTWNVKDSEKIFMYPLVSQVKYGPCILISNHKARVWQKLEWYLHLFYFWRYSRFKISTWNAPNLHNFRNFYSST